MSGGARRGADHTLHKLTDEQIVAIREAYASGAFTQTDLAESYGITQSRISLIVNGKAWSHVSGPVLDSSTTTTQEEGQP